MRIISKFHDYYDCIQGLGQDRETVFLRNVEYVPRQYNGTRGGWCPGSIDFALYTHRFIFCNKPYQITQVVDLNQKLSDAYFLKNTECKEYICNFLTKKQIEKHKGFLLGDYSGEGKWARRYHRKEEESDKFWTNKYSFDEPIIILPGCGDYQKIVNGRLEDFHFQKIKDPYTAFQEIYQFISNRANPEPYVPELTDKEKIISKSFDPVHSFRSTK